MTASFDRWGPAEPTTPLVLSVPHGGRDYPAALIDALAVPLERLLPLEDRLVDTLVAAAIDSGTTAFVARKPRAWIDLNRAEHERDPRVDDGASALRAPFVSMKVKGGLGLVPRRASGAADIWRRRFGADEIAARIAVDHRPYHLALATALQAARARFGIAVLLDVHSMPPLDDGAAQVVVGDRFGRSAAARFVARIEGAARRAGLRSALNVPYSGGHILERHGAPGKAIHAVQLELDRALYLDPALREASGGFAATAAFLRDTIDALVDEAWPSAIAAE